jgi:hypothetical protein
MMESGVEFVAVDNPHASKLTLHILAVVHSTNAKFLFASRQVARLRVPAIAGLGRGTFSELLCHGCYGIAVAFARLVLASFSSVAHVAHNAQNLDERQSSVITAIQPSDDPGSVTILGHTSGAKAVACWLVRAFYRR